MLYAVSVGGLVAGAAVAGDAIARLFGRPTRHLWSFAMAMALAAPGLVAWRATSGGGAPDDPSRARLANTPDTASLAEALRLPPLVIRAGENHERLDRLLIVAWATLSRAGLGWTAGGSMRLRGMRRRWRRTTMDGIPVRLSLNTGRRWSACGAQRFSCRNGFGSLW